MPFPRTTKQIVTAATLLALPMLAAAANVTLKASDTVNTSSFNTFTNWGPDSTGLSPLAPQPTNDYYTSMFFFRTPTGSGNFTFAGNSLTLQTPSGQSAPIRSFLFKGSGGNIYTINNLTNAGGIINSGSGNVAAPTFTGNLMTVVSNSSIQPDQGPFIIGYPIVGSANLTNSGTSGGVHTATYTGSLSGFTGKLIAANVNGGITVALNAGSTAPGNPATPTPDQITIAIGCTLQDNVGLLFTNANGGFTLSGNGNISAAGTTTIGEPITDITNGVHSVSSLTLTGAGTVVLSNANNTYFGATTISAGLLQFGVDNAIPAPVGAGLGDVTDNGSLDLNAHNATINALNGAGTVDTSAGGTPTLTIGANGDSGTFSGSIQNSSGALSVVKVGSGTETFSGSTTYSGVTVVAGGILNFSGPTTIPSTPGSLMASNGAAITANVSGGTPLTANLLIIATNSVLNLTLSPTATAVNATGAIFEDNATNNFTYLGVLAGNPTAPMINLSGPVSASGSNIVINIAATGLQPGTFTLIKYTGTPLASIANFQVSPPPGVAATLVNNTANDSIDLQITSIPNQLSWDGLNGASWDLVTANWSNTVSGAIMLFQQYTNGAVVAGDAVTFDDTLTNDLVNPQPTNVVLNSRFYAFPVVVNSTLPYSITGSGGIAGVTSLLKTNTGSLTLLTSNSFTGGVNISGGTLLVTNDSALGASSGSVTLNGGILQFNGGVTNNRALPMPSTSSIGVAANNTVRLTGVISGAGALNVTNGGTLTLAAHETFTGSLWTHNGTLIVDSGGSINNGGSYTSIGISGSDNATLILQGTGTFTNTGDFNIGDIDTSTGTMNLLGSSVLSIQNFFIGSANASVSTASGTVNINGGTLIEKNTAAGNFVIGGRNSASTNGVGVINLTNGYISAACGVRVGDFGTGTVNQYGGLLEVTNGGTGINLHRENTTGSAGTYNLNGGTLRTEKVTTSTAGVNSLFYFNGGTLQAGSGNLGTTPFMNFLVHAYVRNGPAIIDDHGYTITISQGLEHSTVAGDNPIDGGLIKLGSGTLTMTGTNTYTGPTTNNNGMLILNGASTYTGSLVINTGAVQVTTASTLQGSTVVNNGTLLTVNQAGSGTLSLGTLTLNGTTTLPGATVSMSPTVSNNPAVPLLNCSTLTLNGTNTISIPLETVGTIAIIKYTTLAGSGNCTNLALPQGAAGYISNNVANSTLYAVITSTGPGIFWAGGTNGPAGRTNLWDVSTSTNWLLNVTPTTYHQVVVPGDSVTFNDAGNGIVVLNSTVGPTSLTISNNTRNYAFSGTGGVTGPTGLLKLGTGTAVLNTTNNTYSGNTTISNGVLQVVNSGVGNSLSPTANLVIGPSGTLNLQATLDNPLTTVNELTGSGAIHYNGAHSGILVFGSSAGGTWNGTVYDDGSGQGLAFNKRGTGTSVVGGPNNLDNGNSFSVSNIFTAGTTILTNNGTIVDPTLQTFIAYGPGSTATMIVAGGTLSVGSDILGIGYSTNSVGTLIVNSGTVSHSGGTTGHFGGENNIIVGTAGGVGTMIVNGGRVLNTQGLVLGEGPTGSGTLYLNGGLVQASLVFQNNAPTNSIAFFNGGTLQAVTNNADYLRVTSMVMSNGLVLDDNGYTLSIGASAPLQSGDSFNGGLVKTGSGSVYLDGGNTYTGTTVVSKGFLAGGGNIAGPVVVAPGGNLGAGDAGATGTFALMNNLTLQGNATMRINVTGNFPAQDQLSVSGNVSYGGVLTVTNITSDTTVLTNGNTFQLFSVAGTSSGNFGNIAGSPGAGLAYSFNPTNGVLSVVTQTIAPNTTNITVRVTGNLLSLSWPQDHQGWILQVQTNSPGSGLSPTGTWFTVSGSTSVTNETITIDPTQPTVFYRLLRPF